MELINRTGPPAPTSVRGDEYDLSVPLSGRPSVDWRRAFHAAEHWTEPCHPTRVKVTDKALMFTSEEPHVRLWIQLIDEWIGVANAACAAGSDAATRREVQQSEDERERRRRIEEATERYKHL